MSNTRAAAVAYERHRTKPLTAFQQQIKMTDAKT
jgi:hypothetical protein